MTSVKKTKDFVTLRSRKRMSGLEALYLDICVDGKRKSEYLKLYLTGGKSREEKAQDKETMRKAEIIRAQRVMELQNRRNGLSVCKADSVLFYPYLDSYIKAKNPNSQNCLITLRNHLRAYDGDEQLSFADITREWVSGFLKYLASVEYRAVSSRGDKKPGRRLADATKKMLFLNLRAVVNQALRDEVLGDDPMRNMKAGKAETKERAYLEPEEIRLLANTPMDNAELKRMFLFCCLTGLRWSDAVALCWDNIRRTGDGVRVSLRQQKTGNEVCLNLESQAIALLGEMGKGPDKVFSLNLKRCSCHLRILQWVRDAGIDKHITFHCARHTFATLLISQGVDIYTVSKLLGHTNVQTTQIYAKLVESHRSEAMSRLPKIM